VTKSNNLNAVIAINRFGFGGASGEIRKAAINPKQTLINSLSNITPPSNAPTAIKMMRLFSEHKYQKEDLKNKLVIKKQNLIKPKKVEQENAVIVLKEAINSKNSVNWRLLDFFSNHFSVTPNNTKTRFITPSMEWDAIAPNLMGSFSKMLIAVTSHPAMLLYLNNENSIGPRSKNGKKNKKLGINENLAREIFELHTLGVDSGYTQDDIIELAKGISGWSVINPLEPEDLKRKKAFIFKSKNHEPGHRVILNKKYFERKNGIKQGKSILKDLAKHPATAKHICTKLARHFISDTPDEKLIHEMVSTWLKTRGNLKYVYKSMLNSKYAWEATPKKYKTPREYVISTFRLFNKTNASAEELMNALNNLGQPPFRAGSPKGYGDTKSHWDGASSLYTRIKWAAQIAKKNDQYNIKKLIETSLSNNLSEQTQLIVSRAESQQQAITLLLASPDFLYR